MLATSGSARGTSKIFAESVWFGGSSHGIHLMILQESQEVASSGCRHKTYPLTIRSHHQVYADHWPSWRSFVQSRWSNTKVPQVGCICCSYAPRWSTLQGSDPTQFEVLLQILWETKIPATHLSMTTNLPSHYIRSKLKITVIQTGNQNLLTQDRVRWYSSQQQPSLNCYYYYHCRFPSKQTHRCSWHFGQHLWFERPFHQGAADFTCTTSPCDHRWKYWKGWTRGPFHFWSFRQGHSLIKEFYSDVTSKS